MRKVRHPEKPVVINETHNKNQDVVLDVGEVLLTNGWDHLARKRAAKNFKLSWSQMEARHRLVFETHEEGKLTFEGVERGQLRQFNTTHDGRSNAS